MEEFMKHVPNILTIVRFILIPFIVYFAMKEQYIITTIILIISGITDILDGIIARKFNFITDFGKLMDPLADKATQVATLVVLVLQNIIPFWILAVVIIKEFNMVAGASFLYGKETVVFSKWYGKLSTVLFYIAIFSSLIIKYFNITFNFADYIYYLAVAVTIFSLIMYFKAFWVKGYIKEANTNHQEEENKKHLN